MSVDLTGKRVCIFGLQGSGKTNFTKSLISDKSDYIIYDPLHEYKGYNRYLPQYRDYSEAGQAELNAFIKKFIIPADKRPALFMIDEANRYCPNKRPLPDMVEDLNDFNRHYGLSLGFAARRPVQLNTDLVELAHYLVIFNLTGKNDYQYLESLADGLGDLVKTLPEYHYVLVDPQRNYKICAPVGNMGATPKM